MRRMLVVCIGSVLQLAPLAAQGDAPTWRAEPLWRVASGDVESGWSAIDWVSVRGDGLIAVSQPEDGAVWFVTRDGEPTTTIGRRGSGPGEFRSMPVAGWRGDSLLVFDRGNARVTTLHPGTGLHESRPFRTTLGPSNDGVLPPTRLVGPAPLGGALVLVAASDNDPLPQWPAPAGHSRLAVTNASGELLRQVALLPPDPCFVGTSIAGNRASVRVPLCQPNLWAVDPAGTGVVVVTIDSAHTTLVTVTNLTSVARRRFTVRVESTPVPRSTRDSLRNSLAQAMPSPAVREYIENELPIPENHPLWRAVIRDRDGRTWLEQWPNNGASHWWVLSPSGTLLGRLKMPEGMALKAIDRERAIAVHTDALGEESVVGLRIRQ